MATDEQILAATRRLQAIMAETRQAAEAERIADQKFERCRQQHQRLQEEARRARAAFYMPPGGLSAAPYGTLMGAPIMETEWNATIGTQGDIILADLSQICSIMNLIDRESSSLEASPCQTPMGCLIPDVDYSLDPLHGNGGMPRGPFGSTWRPEVFDEAGLRQNSFTGKTVAELADNVERCMLAESAAIDARLIRDAQIGATIP